MGVDLVMQKARREKDGSVSSHCREDYGCSCIRVVVDDREASSGRSGHPQHSNRIRKRIAIDSFSD